jgi:hypothetical protein
LYRVLFIQVAKALFEVFPARYEIIDFDRKMREKIEIEEWTKKDREQEERSEKHVKRACDTDREITYQTDLVALKVFEYFECKLCFLIIAIKCLISATPPKGTLSISLRQRNWINKLFKSSE